MADSHNKCLIVGPSNLYLPLLLQLKKTASHVIAVDGGGNGIYKSGFKPDYMIGDWDSISQEAKEYFMSQEIPSQTFPVEKDLSDLEIAIQYAWRNGHRNFIFTGFLGGRISHELFNIEVLKKLKKKGCRVSLRERKARLEFLQANEALKLPKNVGISILPDNKAMISLYGHQWNLKNKEIFSGNTLTLSNFTVEEGCVVVKDGLVIVIIEPLSSKNGK